MPRCIIERNVGSLTPEELDAAGRISEVALEIHPAMFMQTRVQTRVRHAATEPMR